MRALERYGLEVGEATRAEIIGAIRSNRSKLVERQSLRVSVHDVQLTDGPLVRVVYDRRRKELVSFLPRT